MDTPFSGSSRLLPQTGPLGISIDVEFSLLPGGAALLMGKLVLPSRTWVDEASRQMGLHFSKAFASHHVPSFVQEFHTSPFQTEGVAGMCELIHLLVWGAQLEAGMPQAV